VRNDRSYRQAASLMSFPTNYIGVGKSTSAFWPRQNYAVLMLRLGRFDASAVISINPRQTKLIFMQQI